MVLIISWWVQPTVIWPYKACSLSWAASNVWYMLKFLLPGSRRTFFKFGHELLFIFFRTHVLWMFLEEGERLLFGLFIFFAKKCLSWLRYFFDAELSAFWFDNDLFFARSDGTYGRDWHSSILFALASCSFWAPGCCTGLLTEEGRGTWHSRSVKRQEDSYKIFFILTPTTEEWGAMFLHNRQNVIWQ